MEVNWSAITTVTLKSKEECLSHQLITNLLIPLD